MSIQRSTLILATSLFVSGAAFAASQDNKREKFEVVETYSGIESDTMIAAESAAVTAPVLPEKERGNLNK